jgi:hypothetical protein
MVGKFNQLVEMQTQFITAHMSEIRDESLSVDRRELLADTARLLSERVHIGGIGPADWYEQFMSALDDNVRRLAELQRNGWLQLLREYKHFQARA